MISNNIMVSLNRKHELFRHYKNSIATFEHHKYFKNNFTHTLRLSRNNYFQIKFTQSARITQGTPWVLSNRLIRCKNRSKDVILNPNGSIVSEPIVIAEVINNYFSNVAFNLDCNIPSFKYLSIKFPWSSCGKSISPPPPLIVKKLVI